ncbi:MAG: hypothetical protein NTZ18_01105 [Candidatus Komeilibacteria bacterium]|nr:hypothetical protein [Candidatus Komeilibacteria bacterium]
MGSKEAEVPELQQFFKHTSADNAEALLRAAEGIKVGWFGNKGLKQLSSAETKSALQNFIVETRKYEETSKASGKATSAEFGQAAYEDAERLLLNSVTEEEYQKIIKYNQNTSDLRSSVMRDVEKYINSAVGKLKQAPEVQKSLQDNNWNSWGNILDGVNNAIRSTTYGVPKGFKGKEKAEN